MYLFKNKKLNLIKGFTLVETMVSIAIATLLTTVLVFRQTDWNDRIAVNTQAYDMMLSIRQTQMYSLGVRENLAGSGDKFNIGYGIYLNRDLKDRYVIFADNNGNDIYDSGESTQTVMLTKGVFIQKICGNSNGLETCFNTDDNNGALRFASIKFLRPNLSSILKFLNSGGNEISSLSAPMSIYLKSAKGDKIPKIDIQLNGQISISK